MKGSSRFTHLNSRYLGGERRELLDKLQYLHTSALYTVPKGFVTDLDSVPRIPGIYAIVKGRAVSSAVVHDYLYRTRYPRRMADKIFWDAMGHEGVPNRYRWPIWLGVRSGGWLAYRRKQT